MDANSPEQLRDRSKALRQAAQYAERSVDMRRDLAEAAKLEKRAQELEVQRQQRRARIAKIKIAQKQLGLDEEAYRDLLARITRKSSASLLEIAELDRVLNEMRRLGFRDQAPARAGERPMAEDRQSKLIRSLWLQLHQAGKVSDPSESALAHWAKGQLNSSSGIEALQWLSVLQKSRLIESLKSWIER